MQDPPQRWRQSRRRQRGWRVGGPGVGSRRMARRPPWAVAGHHD